METPFFAVQHSNIPTPRDNLSRGYVAPERHQAHLALDDLLGRMDSGQLFLMADFFESQSMAIRAHALYLAHKIDADASVDARHHYVTVEGPRAVRRFLRRGLDLMQALTEAAAVTGIRRETVEYHFRRWAKSPEGKGQRLNIMYDMAQLGMTDAQIGRAVYMHEKSVSRALREVRNSRGLKRPKKKAAPASQGRLS